MITRCYLEQNDIEKQNNNKSSSLKFKLDFTHALTNNGKNEFMLKPKGELPPFNSVKEAWCLSHTYWRHDKKEDNGFQNIEASVNLMVKCLECAELQNINIKHCNCVELLSDVSLENDDNCDAVVDARIMSLIVKKDSSTGCYSRDTAFLYAEYKLSKKEIGNISKFL